MIAAPASRLAGCSLPSARRSSVKPPRSCRRPCAQRTMRNGALLYKPAHGTRAKFPRNALRRTHPPPFQLDNRILDWQVPLGTGPHMPAATGRVARYDADVSSLATPLAKSRYRNVAKWNAGFHDPHERVVAIPSKYRTAGLGPISRQRDWSGRHQCSSAVCAFPVQVAIESRCRMLRTFRE